VFKRRVTVAATLVGLLAVISGVAVFSWPMVAAAACPGCYGLRDVGGNVWVENVWAENVGAENVGAEKDDAKVRAAVAGARQRVEYFFGERRSDPRVLICSTQECYRKLGGGQEKGRTVGARIVMISPAGANETIIAHELGHAELHERLGAQDKSIPQWFDEGVAVLVSQDERYLNPSGDRCKLLLQEAARIADRNWWDAAAEDADRAYQSAGCVVWHWTSDRGGGEAIDAMAATLEGGKRFDKIVEMGNLYWTPEVPQFYGYDGRSRVTGS
jgi:hypothetical protein